MELALLGAVARGEPAALVCASPVTAAAAWRGAGARFAAAGLVVARVEEGGGAGWPAGAQVGRTQRTQSIRSLVPKLVAVGIESLSAQILRKADAAEVHKRQEEKVDWCEFKGESHVPASRFPSGVASLGVTVL
jgi:hypothetical protein